MKTVIKKVEDAVVGLYTRLVRMEDSPQRIAAGFGIGVFLGILPGTGPLAAVGLAFLFKFNKAAALMGCLLTNSWLSVVSFVAAIKIGSAALGLNWEEVSGQVRALFSHFSWQALFGQSMKNILFPMLIGYAAVGVISGLVAYGVAILLLRRRGPSGHNPPEPRR